MDRRGHGYKVKFLVVETEATPLLSLKTSQQLGLVKITDSDTVHQVQSDSHSKLNGTSKMSKPISHEQLLNDYKDVFEGLGCLQGEYSIDVDSNHTPVIHAPRKIPIAIRDAVKEELDKLEEEGVIAKVTKPTPWVSSMVVVRKKNGKVRICIDPRDLNKAIERWHYPLPTIEEVATRLTNAKVFSVLDAKSGFWQVKLTEDSSYLTAFNTPFGRYHWRRMPFGIKSAPEIWQRKAHEFAEGLEGVEVIMDDFLVIGFGDTITEATTNHDKNLIGLLERARQRNLTLNPEKIQLRRTEVPFIGHRLTPHGLVVDPEKIAAITNMPTPTDGKSLRRALGMINYLAKFLPRLSSTCEILRQLDHKGVEWSWDERHGQVWEELKKNITEAPVLVYFDTKKEVTIQCDASQSGLGAVLLQDGQPVHYASRALTTAEKNYAQIEKELLAIVFACERFDQYVYGRPVKVESDHKPLEQITKKPFHDAPKRLQRMLLRLQKYDLQITYKKGSLMVLADTLSRAYLGNVPENSNEDTTNDFCAQLEEINLVGELPISEERLEELIRVTSEDAELQRVREYVQEKWPRSQDGLSPEVSRLHPFRNEISCQDGLILKSVRIVVPSALREDMTQRLHSSHIGMEGCLRRAREMFYWPGMSRQIRDHVARCSICNTYQTEQCKEPLLPHQIPNQPWMKVGTDLFTFQNRNYLIVTDYYSNFVEIDQLSSTTSTAVIQKLKSQFSRHGIPKVVVSDNGPQYACEEFRKFAKEWEFSHVKSSPYFPQSNGKVENAVKTVKGMMKKALLAKTDIHLALLEFRNTPSEADGASPAQKLFSRRTRTRLPITGDLLRPQVIPSEKIIADLKKAKEKQKRNYDSKAHILPPLHMGEPVRMKLPGQQEWSPAICTKYVGPRSYEVVCADKKYRRNRRQLRKTQAENRSSSPETESRVSHSAPTDFVLPSTVEEPGDNLSTRRSVRTRRLPSRFQDYKMD